MKHYCQGNWIQWQLHTREYYNVLVKCKFYLPLWAVWKKIFVIHNCLYNVLRIFLSQKRTCQNKGYDKQEQMITIGMYDWF